ncbi:family 1 encapsulin nanocompartment shell protein [Saccharicrinis sp. FJH54]|uniref:family 1 encapsulin nanocompartment shell protein n=1 Tax=Saccharicrinis sp. FJH54 TaxID=3344665 RepID=UPI0035D47F8B
MNILKKSLAPITDKGWEEITDKTSQYLDSYLTARKFIDIDGPNGMEQGGVSTGHLITPDNQSDKGVNYGVREILPFVEIRKPFELDLWELDNLERGARDINLEPLEEAVKEIALFEENAVYEGFEPAQIKGLHQVAEYKPVTLPKTTNAFLKEIGNQIIRFERNGVSGPYTLIMAAKEWIDLVQIAEGYPILKQLKEIIGGKVIINQSNNNSYLVTERGGDYELVLGQDISVGYDSHNTKSVKLYLTASFTFRVLSPEAIIVLSADKKA